MRIVGITEVFLYTRARKKTPTGIVAAEKSLKNMNPKELYQKTGKKPCAYTVLMFVIM